MKEIFKTNYVNIIFDEENKIVTTKWTTEKFDSDQYKEVWNKTIEFGNNNDVDYFLSDIIDQKVVAPNDRKWFEDEAIPRAIKTGIKKGAIVLGANPFKVYYFNNIMKKIGGTSLPFKAFKNKEKAYEWFLEK
jgi:hypothetical protein